MNEYKATYVRLVDPATQQGKEDMFLAGENRYEALQSNFSKIPGSPVAYWVGNNTLALLTGANLIGEKYSVGSGLSTSDNERFLRFFWEIDIQKLGISSVDNAKWFFFQKGGAYRRWFGNLSYVVNWENNGADIKYWVTHNPKDPKTTSWSRRIFNTELYFLKGITWGVITSGNVSFRMTTEESMISNAAGGIFHFKTDDEMYATLGALNTKIWTEILNVINPTINCSSGIVAKAPAPSIAGAELAKECVSISKCDWDSFETSWDFKKHPLV